MGQASGVLGANNIEPYTFIMLFPGKSDTPYPQLRYVTLEWPLPDTLMSDEADVGRCVIVGLFSTCAPRHSPRDMPTNEATR